MNATLNPAMAILGIFTVLSACGVIFSTKTLNSALCLVLTFFLIAGHYTLIHADFIAALQILVYAGAIMVLIVFVIMLLGLNEKVEKSRSLISLFLSIVFTAAFIGMLAYAVDNPGVFPVLNNLQTASVANFSGSPESVSAVLFSKFLYSFEIVSLLLLSAIVAAVVLAYDPKRELPKGRGLKAKRSEG